MYPFIKRENGKGNHLIVYICDFIHSYPNASKGSHLKIIFTQLPARTPWTRPRSHPHWNVSHGCICTFDDPVTPRRIFAAQMCLLLIHSRMRVCVCRRLGSRCVCSRAGGAEGRVLPLHWLSIAVSLLRVAHTWSVCRRCLRGSALIRGVN